MVAVSLKKKKAVKPYYERFLQELPDVKALAEVPEDRLLKLWEGLGYYSRARNLKEAAIQIMERYGGKFPETYEEILSLKGIGSYTAGAIASFVYHIPKAAVDGNVLRVVTRVLAYSGDIMKASVKKEIERLVEDVIPVDCPGDFNQGLIELGAVICLPNGEPRCGECPVQQFCLARSRGEQMNYPVKKKAKERRKEDRTVFIFRDENKVAIRKRGAKGLLAGLYEFPNVEGHLTQEEAIRYGNSLGLVPVRVKRLADAKHIFSHVEWNMIGYEILVDELEREMRQPAGGERAEGIIFAGREEIEKKYPVPSAFAVYTESARFS